MADDQFLIGIDMGTGGARAGVFDTSGKLRGAHTVEWKTNFPSPGRAEQDPDEWWKCTTAAVKGAMEKAGASPDAVAGISYDCTASTVIAMDANNRHLRPALLWMDVRSTAQSDRLYATGDPALKYCGMGPVSPEWGMPKSMWIKENEPDLFAKAKVIGDETDWLTFKLTGEWTMSISHASAKYFWDKEWPTSFYAKVDAEDILDKFPKNLQPLGAKVGELTQEAASEMGLTAGTPVVQGGVDAYIGAVGLGMVEPGTLALITGSSHVIVGQFDEPIYGSGWWGTFTDAVIPGQYTIDAGQISTGSVVAWFKNTLAMKAQAEAKERGCDPYDVLNEMAAEVPIGCEGLVMLDHFQGNRAPYSDPRSRGVFWGLSLAHTEGHMYRAILEGICYGTENLLRVMRAHGLHPKQMVISGGATRSKLWTQMHADVSNMPLVLTDVTEGPIMGSAMLAGVGAGVFKDLPEASHAMVHTVDVVEPNKEAHEAYQFNQQAYIDTYPVMQGLLNKMSRHLFG